MIILGDQSPWIRGLLRYKVLLESPEFSSQEIAYFLHDYDSPWVQDGSKEIVIRERWRSYISLGSKFPWTPDTPQTDGAEKNFQTAVRNSLKIPKGLNYLSGPAGPYTIFSEMENVELKKSMKQLLDKEIEWINRLREMMRLKEVRFNFSGNPSEDTRKLLALLGIKNRIITTTGIFKEIPPVALKALPKNYFWLINDSGYRKEFSYYSSEHPPKGTIIVPKGEIIPIEYALRGWQLCVTNLRYLGKTLFLRDKFIPGVKINIIKVSFSWKTSKDLIEIIKEVFYEKKKKRNPEFSPNSQWEIYWNKIKDYWASSPTVLGFLLLSESGQLEYTIESESF